MAPADSFCLQAQQLLGLLGVSSKRLQVPPTAVLKPVLSQLQRNQRVLMLHHDPETQQLVLAAWGVPGAALSSEAQAALSSAAVAADEATVMAGATAGAGDAGKAASQSGSAQFCRASKTSVVGLVTAGDPASAPAAAAAAAAAAVPPPALLGSMSCTQQQIQQLSAAFGAYSNQLQRAITQVTSSPVPASAAELAATATAAAGVAATASTAAGKKHAGGAASKGSSKEKGSKDTAPSSEVPDWVPATPVFPLEINDQWQQLMQQVRLQFVPEPVRRLPYLFCCNHRVSAETRDLATSIVCACVALWRTCLPYGA
jgi:hypothetical protein